MVSQVKVNVDALTDLALLEVGDLDPKAARELIARIVAERIDTDVGADIYAAMRTWVGRLLRSSSGGNDLRAWYTVVRATGAQFRGDLREWEIRLSVLGELLFERVGMAETRDQEAVLSRRHSRAVLNELLGEPAYRMSRSDLRASLGLEQANLTRVCTMLLDAGLITRLEEGRTVSFALTAEGATWARPKFKGASLPEPRGREIIEWEVQAPARSSPSVGLDDWAKYDRPLEELPLLPYLVAA